jgi:hypothetical protein
MHMHGVINFKPKRQILGHLVDIEQKLFPQQRRSTRLVALLPTIHRTVETGETHVFQAVLPTTPSRHSTGI